jgi:hypothetical protein
VCHFRAIKSVRTVAHGARGAARGRGFIGMVSVAGHSGERFPPELVSPDC